MIFTQIWIVVIMNIRSLPDRLGMSLATIFTVAAVMSVLLFFLSMGNGFQSTLKNAGSRDTAIVTREGSRSEVNSVLTSAQIKLLATAPGIARNSVGNPIYSGELYVIVDGIKKSSGTSVNLPLRGLSKAGLALRTNVKIIKGRSFTAGRNEIIVGQSVLKLFSGFELGKKITFNKTVWQVVGVFSTGGSVFESELWADVHAVQNQFRRSNSFQSMRIRLKTPGDIAPLVKFAANDPRLNVKIETESNYFATQSKAIKGYVIFGWALSIIMSLGALAGALNAMYTSVAARTSEIATLRAIGFSNTSAFVGTLIEALILSLIGGLVGIIIAYLFIDGTSASTIGGNFTQVVFDFSLSTSMLMRSLWVALAIGLLGGIFPAWRAAHIPVVAAFK